MKPPFKDAKQRANAAKNVARNNRERHTRPKTVIDWDAAIERFKAMLDRIEEGK